MMFAAAVAVVAATVTVSNTVDVARTETVSAAWKELGVKSSALRLRVVDSATGKAVPHQNDAAGTELLFSVDLKGLECRTFKVFADASGKVPSADLSAVCWCGYIPERMDDFAWENDCFGARAYGQAIMQPRPKGQGLVSSGIDIFNKCVSYPLLEMWLKYRAKGAPSYHKNSGEGMDCYLVGPGRGCGGVGARDGQGKWLYSANWAESKVAQVGPVRCEFDLVYEAWGGFGRETRHVILDRGQSLAKMTAAFDSFAEGALVGPGLDVAPERKHGGEVAKSEDEGWIAAFEPEDPEDGSLMTAIVLDPASMPAEIATDGAGCVYLLARPAANAKSVTYYTGANWTGQKRFCSAADWHRYVKDFATCLRNPVKVSVSRK